MSGATLLLTGPSHVRTWVERHYASRVSAILRRESDALEQIGFLPDGPESVSDHDPRSTQASYKFERFVIDAGNHLAHAAALAVAERPGEAYNPLFLYGPPGLGKSHLLMAISSYMAAHHSTLAVRYTTAERFTTEFVGALRDQGIERFKRHHRDLAALLIDDIHFLEAKPRTEDEFFHTFNALHEAGSQIVLSSDRPPQALERLTARLRERFEWGLCVEITPPHLRARTLLLQRLALERGLGALDPSTLEGALTRVTAISSITGQPMSRELVQRALGTDQIPTPIPSTHSSAPDVKRIQTAVCSVLHVSLLNLTSPKRTPDLVRARHLGIYVTRQLTDLSLAEIGRHFNRDHSTVLHAIRTTSRKLEPNSDLQRALHQVHTRLAQDVTA